ncbi:FUSC family protein [Arthrobacter yangruifuii]|uniref:FUSC family protein n=1 Tax=Arthrobacter yangruifuii TaxID=2606616 RepID=UPI001FED3078|nr:FUSC family protein [Arthrobacter yangruifuii]
MTHLQEMFRIAPAHNDHHAAIRCAVGIGMPLFLVLFLGRIDLAIFATFGAFTGIYGRNEPHRQRLGHQGRAGVLMLAVILAAALSARLELDAWGTVVGTTAVAGLGTVVTGFWRLRPVGSLFHIFAFAAISSVPDQPPLWQGMLAAVLTVAFSILLGLSGMLVRRYRTEWTRPERPRFSAAQRRLIFSDGLQYAVAAVLAGSIATLLGIGHNYWAMVAATVPLIGATVRHRVHRGLQRILGTFGGLLLTALILLPGLEPWQMVLVIAACQFGAEMFIARQYALAQVVVTPLALVSTELAHPSNPMHLLRDRGIETLIGAVVGMAVVVAAHLRQQHLRQKNLLRKQAQQG